MSERCNLVSEKYTNSVSKLTTLDRYRMVASYLDMIRGDEKGGPYFRSNLRRLGSLMMGAYFCEQKQDPIPPSLLIDIPRGGTPLTDGIASFFDKQVPVVKANTGENKNPNNPLLPEELFGNYGHIMIGDTIIGSGKTIIDILNALKAKEAEAEKITVVSVISTPQGIDAILEARPEVDIISATVEPKCKWVDINGKKVLFVDGIGDVGTLVSKE